jgi:hypothetical protein
MMATKPELAPERHATTHLDWLLVAVLSTTAVAADITPFFGLGVLFVRTVGISFPRHKIGSHGSSVNVANQRLLNSLEDGASDARFESRRLVG